MHQSIPCHRSLRVLLSEPSTVAFMLRIIEINLFYLTLKILLSSKSWSVFFCLSFPLFCFSFCSYVVCVCHVASIFERSLRYFFLIFFFRSFSILVSWCVSLQCHDFLSSVLTSFIPFVSVSVTTASRESVSVALLDECHASIAAICNLTPAAAKSETLPKPSKLSATTFLLDLGAGLSKICSL